MVKRYRTPKVKEGQIKVQKPKDFDLKKWLCANTITGITVHYIQTGNDTAETHWELMTHNGAVKTVNATTARPLIDIDENHWCKIASAKPSIRAEVENWESFVAEEAADFAEYQRLQKKFGAI